MLKSQIAPHFLYNYMRSPSSSSSMDTYSDCLSKLKANSLTRDRIVSLTSLILCCLARLLIQARVHIQQVRYGEQYRYRLDIDPALMPCWILKLTLQPLVMNALFHGICNGGLITIKGKLEKGMIRLYVRDNGIGISRDEIRKALHDHFEQELSKYRFTRIGLAQCA